MATIPVSQAKNFFTQDLIAVLNITPPESSFLQDKFRQVYKPVDYVQWQVRRWTEVRATSVVRGTNGDRIKANGFTQKIEQAPFFHLYFDIMQLQGYTAAFGTNNPAESSIDDMLEQAAFMYGEMKGMIKRRWEYMAAQAYQTGIITDNTTGNIDFKRNALSMVDLGAGNYWDNSSVSPFDVMEQGGVFLRQYGKVGGMTIDCIMGASAYRSFLKNNVVLERAQKLWNQLTDLTMPAIRNDGSVFMGQVSAGPYLVNIFTYPQYFTESTEYQAAVTVQTIAGSIAQTATTNTSAPYIDDVNIVMIPTMTDQIFASALVPRLPSQVEAMGSRMGNMGELEDGKFFAYDYEDPELTAWKGNLKAVGLPILARVDEVFTAKVMGS